MVRKYFEEEIIVKAQEALKKSKETAVFKRAMSILLTARDGYSFQEAAKILGVCVSTLTQYRREFSEGTYNLPKPPKTGSASHLTWEQEKQVLKRLEDRAKSGELTTIWQIKEEYEKEADCVVGKSTIYRFLERHEWRKVTPRPRHPKSNPEAQEEYKKTAGSLAGNRSRYRTRTGKQENPPHVLRRGKVRVD
jgi:transposase